MRRRSSTTWLSQRPSLGPWIFGRLAVRPYYPLPVNIVGNPDLTEQSLDAFEIGYSGVLSNHAVVSAAFYVNNVKEDILFTEDARDDTGPRIRRRTGRCRPR